MNECILPKFPFKNNFGLKGFEGLFETIFTKVFFPHSKDCSMFLVTRPTYYRQDFAITSLSVHTVQTLVMKSSAVFHQRFFFSTLEWL